MSSGFYTTPLNAAATERSGQARCEAGYFCSGGVRTSCPAGKYSGAVGATNSGTCQDCTRGFFCPLSSTQPTEQPCGFGQPAGQEANVYCPAGTNTRLTVQTGQRSLPADAPPDQRYAVEPCPLGHECRFGIAYPFIQFTAPCGEQSTTTNPFLGSVFTGTSQVDENVAAQFTLTYMDQDAANTPIFQGARAVTGFTYGAACPSGANMPTAFSVTDAAHTANSGSFNVAVNPAGFNYEGCPVIGYDLVFLQRGLEFSCRMLTTVGDVNDAPVFLADSTVRAVVENEQIGVPVGDPVATSDEDDGQEVTYEILSGNDLGYFSISLCSGQIFVARDDISYEQPGMATLPFVDLVIRASDNGRPIRRVTKTVRVRITNVNEDPIFETTTGTLADGDLGYGFTISESAAIGSLVGVAEVTDPDRFPMTYSIVQRNGQAGFEGNPEFVINPNNGEIRTNRLLDFESVQEYDFTFSVLDQFPAGTPGRNISLPNSLTIRVLDENDPPVVSVGSALSIDETATVGSLVTGNVRILDPETRPAQVTAVTILNSSSVPFTPVPAVPATSGNATLYTFELTSAMLNFEVQPTYTFDIRVEDQGQAGKVNQFTVFQVTIRVNDVNEPPTFPAAGYTFSASIAENSPAGINVLATPLQYTDVDNNGMQRANFRLDNYTTTFTLGAVEGMLRVAQDVLDFERQSMYGVVITVVDTGLPAQSTTATLPVTIINVNEPPMVVPGQVFTISENTVAGTSIGTLSVYDEDSLVPSEGESHTWSNLRGSGLFNARSAVVSGNTIVNTVELFRVDSATGEVFVNNGIPSDVWISLLDFENMVTMDLTVTVTDAGIAGGPAYSRSGSFQVTLTNVPEAPLVVDGANGGPQSRAVAEEAPLGTKVGAPLQILDQENNTYTCAFVTPPAAWEFQTVSGSSGCQIIARTQVPEITVVPAAPTITMHPVTVTDSTGQQAQYTIEIVIADDNRYPQFASHTVQVREDAPLNSAVGARSDQPIKFVTDEDSTDTHQFFVLDYVPVATNTWFYIANADVANGTLSVGAALDYELYRANTPPSTIQLTLQVQDSGTGSLANTSVWNVQVLNVNEPPSFNAPAVQLSVPETTSANGGSSVGDVVGTVTWEDQDKPDGDTFTLSIVQPVSPLLSVSDSGVVTIIAPLSHESTPELHYVLRVCDAGNFLPPPGHSGPLCAERNFTFVVTDVNEPPTAYPATLQVSESSAPGATVLQLANGTAAQVGGVVWTDPDSPAEPFGQVVYTITAGDSAFFSVDPSTGYIILLQEVDFEDKQAYKITVRVQDDNGAGYTASAEYTILIQDDNDITAALWSGSGQLVHPTTGSNGDMVVFFNGTQMGPTKQFLASTSVQLSDVVFSALVTFNTGESNDYPQGIIFSKTVPCRREHSDSPTDNTAVACSVPEGVGVITWRIQTQTPLVDAAGNTVGPGSTSSQVTQANGQTTYAAPEITAVTLSAAFMSTQGGDTLVIEGRNLGPMDNAFVSGDVQYGVSSPLFSAVACAIIVPHTRLACETVEGVGVGQSVAVRVGGLSAAQQFTPSISLSYAAPEVDTVQVLRAGVPVSTMATAGGDTLRISGANFGPTQVTLDNNGVALTVPILVAVQFGLPAGSSAANFPTASSLRYTALTCTHIVAPHTQINCLVPPGTGAAHIVRVAVAVDNSNFATQWSSLAGSPLRVSYAAPVVTEVTGPGVANGRTSGNDLIRIRGRNFGKVTPLRDDTTWDLMGNGNSQSSCTNAASNSSGTLLLADLPVVRYGRPSAGSRQFSARFCVVLSDTDIECCSAPGTGNMFQYSVSLDSQTSAPLYVPLSSYHPPVVAEYLNAAGSGPALASGTRGGMAVTIGGSNFGDDTQWIDSVFYGKDGGKEYTATECVLVTPHTKIRCNTVFGAGSGLSWTVVVDTLQSEAPSTSYAAPLITGFAGAAVSGAASTLGGQQITLTGTNFGPADGAISVFNGMSTPGSMPYDFLEWVKYGPVTGQEYTATNCTTVSHTAISCLTAPGAGGDLIWTARVQGRTGAPSTAKWSYATPSLTTLVTPFTGVPTRGGVSGTVRGLNLGTTDVLFSPEFEVVLPRNPTQTIRVAAEQKRRLPSGEEEVDFFFPAGYGDDAQIRLVARGAQTLVSNTLTYSYNAPVWTSYKVRGDTVASLVRVQVTGRNFGPSTTASNGALIAQLRSGSETISASRYVSWSHDFIEFKLERPSTGTGPDAALETAVVVSLDVFRVVVPAFNGSAAYDAFHTVTREVAMDPPSIAGRESVSNAELDTAGGTPIFFQVRGISNDSADLSISVGPGSQLASQPDGFAVTTPVDRDNECRNINVLQCTRALCCVSQPCDDSNFEDTYYVSCVTPAGQGMRNRLKVVFSTGADIGLGNSNSSADQIYFAYRRPMLTNIQYGATALRALEVSPARQAQACAPGDLACCQQQDMNQRTMVCGLTDTAGTSQNTQLPVGGRDEPALAFESPTTQGAITFSGSNLGVSAGVRVTTFGGIAGAASDFLLRPAPPALRVNPAHTSLVVFTPPGINGEVPVDFMQLEYQRCGTFGCGTLDQVADRLGDVNFTPQEYATDTQLPDPVQACAETGCGVPGAVTAPTRVAFKYAGPTVNRGTFKAPTTGSARLLLNGTNFGPASKADFVNVTIGGRPCELVLYPDGSRWTVPGVSPHNQIACDAPAGVGKQLEVVVQIGTSSVTIPPGQDPYFDIGYEPPIVTSFSPNIGPTRGGLPMVVTGRNFGTSASDITIRFLSDPCLASNVEQNTVVPQGDIVSVTNTRIEFLMPEGQGGTKLVEIDAGGQRSIGELNAVCGVSSWPPAQYAAFAFDYLPPTVDEITPSCDTFGCTISITGENFGTRDCNAGAGTASGNNTADAPVEVFLYPANTTVRHPDDHKYVCLPICNGHTHERFQCALDAGMGKELNVTVRIGSKVANLETITYSYAAPRITATVTSHVNAMGSQNLTFYGKSFGTPGRSPTRVTIGGEPCVGASVGIIDASARAQSLQCLRENTQTVGPKRLTYELAFQDSRAVEAEDGLVQFFCPDGFYGQPGELCEPCPRGAECPTHRLSCDEAIEDTLYGAELCTRYQEPYAQPEHWMLTLNTPNEFCARQNRNNRAPPFNGTCSFFAGCQPPEACAGNNTCSLGYTGERCGVCILGFYKFDGECVRCPDLAGLYIALFVLGILFIAGAGWWLNKQKINLAFVSIGVDYLQVLALFARTKVSWPPFILAIFRALSALNLNIDLAAPECLSPEIGYGTKWTATMLLPLLVAGVFFLVYVGKYVYKRFVLRVNAEKRNTHLPQLVGVNLTLFYLLYLYLTRTTFDVFNCSPTDPDDGNVYLEVVFEKCWDSDLHNTLFPAAIVTLIFYVIAYPILVGYTLYKNKDKVKIDQLLRAMFLGDERATSTPAVYEFRKMAEKLYRNFKPGKWYWQVVIILRKFAIAVTSLLFRRTPSYQMALIVLVLFFSYAAQVRQRPYMSMSEYRAEVLYHERKVIEGDKRHMMLNEDIKGVKRRNKKRGQKQTMDSIRAHSVKGGAAAYITNYNTVEMVLLLCAILIALGGVMFDSQRFADGKSSEGRIALTVIIAILIFTSMIYFVAVCVSEIMEAVAPERFERTCKCCRAEKSTIELEVERGMLKAGLDDAANSGTAINPLVLKKQTTESLDEETLSMLNSILQSGKVPTNQHWQAIRRHVLGMRESVDELNLEMRSLKKAQTLAQAKKSLNDNSNKKPKKRGRKQFGQTSSRSNTTTQGVGKKAAWAESMKAGSGAAAGSTADRLRQQAAQRG